VVDPEGVWDGDAVRDTDGDDDAVLDGDAPAESELVGETV
jgi:hypothetical protein